MDAPAKAEKFMQEILIFELHSPVIETSRIYRNSPFEYDQTAGNGQYILRVGNLCPMTLPILVDSPFSATTDETGILITPDTQ